MPVLPPGTASVEQVLEVRKTVPCNVHALAESKRATIFGLCFSVGGAEPVLAPVFAGDEARTRLPAFAGEHCKP